LLGSCLKEKDESGHWVSGSLAVATELSPLKSWLLLQ